MENNFKKRRRLEIIIGLCFLLAPVTYSTGNQMITIELQSSLGIILELVNSLAVTVIGFLSFLVLVNYNKKIPKGYMIIRFIEGFLLAIGAVSVILISQDNVHTIMKFREVLFSLAMLFLGGYASYFSWYLMQQQLAPKWIMIAGIAGYLCLFIYSILLLLSLPAPMMLFVPGGLFELIFPIFLIVKGFNMAADK